MEAKTRRETLSRGRVRVLSPELSNQIAAGEVVERPASAVKELVENALDAGARRIFVDLEEGGRKLIRVTDDGCGMTREDARLALERHATSKITTVDDLNAITTLGFRGEALPSIASVSRFRMVTKPPETLGGTEVVVEGGSLASIRDSAAAAGTVIEVAELFFNTPARKKFLKRVATELRNVSEMIIRLAMVWHNVHFRLTHNGRKRLDVPPHPEHADRLLALLGKETWSAMHPLPVLPHVEGVSCSGFFSQPSHTVRGSGSLYTYVNGRYIRDKTILAAISSAYRELLPKGRSPVAVLLLEVPPDFVDVNAHPTKVEVRFRSPDPIFRSVYRGLREGLGAGPWAQDAETTSAIAASASADLAPDPEPSQRQAGLDFRAPGPAPAAFDLGALVGGPSGDRSGPGGQRAGVAEPGSAGYFARLRYIGQTHKCYLLASDADGLVVIDQHAAHERITFQRLKAIWEGRSPEAQQLLFPLQLELDALRAATLEEHLELFSTMGFELMPFGGNAFALKSVPGILAGARYERVIRDAIDDLSNLGRTQSVDDAIEAVISRMACHGSVRAGDQLTPEEADALFAQMDRVDFAANCPHGRPVFFKMTLEELEKRFDRR